MKKGKGVRFTEDDLEKIGLKKQSDGSYKKDIFGQKIHKPTFTPFPAELLIKKPIINTPDFDHTPNIEWFIKNYNVPSKKNSRQNFVRNGKQISIPSKQHAEYVKMTTMQYEVFGIEFRRAVEHYKLKYPLRIEFTFVRNSRHRFDYCNACQTVEDIIVKNKWIEDDSSDHLIPVFAPYEYNKSEFGVKIKLLTNK